MIVEAACEIATRWGGDEHAELRVDTQDHAAELPEPERTEKFEFVRSLDALCDVLGVPIEGSIASTTRPC